MNDSKHKYSTFVLLALLGVIIMVVFVDAIDGYGTINYLAKFVNGEVIGNSSLIDDLNNTLNLSTVCTTENGLCNSNITINNTINQTIYINTTVNDSQGVLNYSFFEETNDITSTLCLVNGTCYTGTVTDSEGSFTDTNDTIALIALQNRQSADNITLTGSKLSITDQRFNDTTYCDSGLLLKYNATNPKNYINDTYGNDTYYLVSNPLGFINISRMNVTSIIPSSAVVGDMILFNTTGRMFLMQYDGSSWIPIYAYGQTIFYVNNNTGQDGQNNGTSLTNAFRTLQYTFNQIPPLFSGNITIYLNNGTFTETAILQGKKPTGAYSIIIQGVVTVLDNLTAATGSLQGTSVDGTAMTYQKATVVRNNSGNWTTDQRKNKWVKFTSGVNNGEYKLIDTNNATVATVVGRWAGGVPAVGNTFVVQQPATLVTDLQIGFGQQNVIINDIDFNFALGTNNGGLFGAYTDIRLNRCEFSYASGAGNSIFVSQSSKVVFDACYFELVRMFFRGGSKIQEGNSIHWKGGTSSTIVQVDEGATYAPGDGTIIDANDVSSSYGIRVYGLGTANLNGGVGANTMRMIIRNTYYALAASDGGQIINAFPPWYVGYGDDRLNNANDQNTANATNKLIDTTVNFTALGIAVGDVVVNVADSSTTDILQTTVSAIVNDTQLTLATDIFKTISKTYRILKQPSLNTNNFDRTTNLYKRLFLYGESNNYPSFTEYTNSDTAWHGAYDLRYRSRGTRAAPLIVGSSDSIFYFDMFAYDGASYNRGAQLGGAMDGTPSAGILPMKWKFSTMDTLGYLADRVTIKNTGNVAIGAGFTAATNTLHVLGGITTSGIAPPVNAAFTSGTGTLVTGTYYYRVTALTSAGETTPSTETSLGITGPAGVNVNWGAVTGATGYKIYGRSAGAELLIATVRAGNNVGTVTTYLDNGSITPSGAMPTIGTTGNINLAANYGNVRIGGAVDVNGTISSSGGSADHVVCWMSDGRTLGYCSTAVDADGICVCGLA